MLILTLFLILAIIILTIYIVIPSNPNYNKEFAADAHKIAIEYLKKGLGL